MLILNAVSVVISATFGIFLISSCGALLTHSQIMTRQFTATLSIISERLLLPALIFTSFLKGLTITSILTLIPSIFTTLICFISGYILGIVTNKFWIKEKRLKSIIALSSANPQTTNIQLQLAYGLSSYLAQQTNQSDKQSEAKLVTIIALQTIIVSLLRWSIGKKILEQNNFDQTSTDVELQDISVPLKETKNEYKRKTCWNAPLIAVFVSFAFILIYPLQDLLLHNQFIHNTFFLPLQTISRAATPSFLMILGSNLYLIYYTEIQVEYGILSVSKIVCNKLIIMPIVGLFIILILHNYQIITDYCQLFIHFITFCTPPSINILVMAKLYKQDSEDILFIQCLHTSSLDDSIFNSGLTMIIISSTNITVLMILLNIVRAVVSATFGVLFISGCGALLTQQKIMTRQFTTILSSIQERLFLPALIFTSFLKAINITTLLTLIPSIVTTFLCVVCGYIIGVASNKFWIKEKKLNSIVVLSSANPHTTNIQLQLSYGLAQYLANLTNQSDKQTEAKLVTIIIIQTVIVNSLRWSIGKKILQQHDSEQKVEVELIDLNAPLTQEEQKKEKTCWNAPLISVCVSIGCILLYPVQDILVGDTFIHNAIYLPLQTISRATTPTVLMILGSNLYLIYFTNIDVPYGFTTVMKIVVNRLVILPFLGLFIVFILLQFNIMNDYCQLFILFITFCTPSAINILVMAKQYQQNAEDIVSLILLYSYILCIGTLPFWMTVYLTIFKP